MLQPEERRAFQASFKYPGDFVAAFPLRRCALDLRYQRDGTSIIEEIRRDFMPLAAGIIVLATERKFKSFTEFLSSEAKASIVDGGQRWAALQRLAVDHNDDNPTWPAIIYFGVPLAVQARAFSLMDHRRKMPAYQVIKAEIAHGDPVAIAIRDIVVAAGFTFGKSRDSRTIQAIGSLKQIYGWENEEHAPGEILAKGLKIWSAFQNKSKVTGEVFKGLCLVLRDNVPGKPSFDRGLFEETLEAGHLPLERVYVAKKKLRQDAIAGGGHDETNWKAAFVDAFESRAEPIETDDDDETITESLNRKIVKRKPQQKAPAQEEEASSE